MIRKILTSFAGQLVLALAGLAIVSACSLEGHATPATSTPLSGTHWNLKILEGASTASQRPLTLSLDSNRLNGFSGCNHYSGNYTRSGGDAMGISALGTTKMACGGEADLLEQHFVGLLSQVKQYAISHDQLHLLGADRKILMVFSRRAEA
jgi:heat shock protein HslJ